MYSRRFSITLKPSVTLHQDLVIGIMGYKFKAKDEKLLAPHMELAPLSSR